MSIIYLHVNNDTFSDSSQCNDPKLGADRAAVLLSEVKDRASSNSFENAQKYNMSKDQKDHTPPKTPFKENKQNETQTNNTKTQLFEKETNENSPNQFLQNHLGEFAHSSYGCCQVAGVLLGYCLIVGSLWNVPVCVCMDVFRLRVLECG